MSEEMPTTEEPFIDPRDNRTVGFTSAEFGNVWAVHRGKAFGDNDLRPFQREWKEWLDAVQQEWFEKGYGDGYRLGSEEGYYSDFNAGDAGR